MAQGLPGAALGVVWRGGERQTLVLGQAQRVPEPLPLDAGMSWDLASLTKPLFTARAVLLALQDGLLDLDDPLSDFLPELAWMQDTPLRQRTLRQLMTHTSGLPAWAPMYTWGDVSLIRARLLQEAWPLGEPVYSDLNYILLGLVLERVRGVPLRDFPMPDGFTAAPDPQRSVTTEHCAWRDRLLRGEVHDENAAALGGLPGHAGLFGTLDGVLDQAQALLEGRWLSRAATELATRPQTEGRTLVFVRDQPGWSGGSLCTPGAYGHTGFTGTGLWVDPGHDRAWVLLTSRVHPSRHTSIDIQRLRRAVGNTVQAMDPA
ncbi:serine hydrolase domain-containing protein [Deinococcus sonorensis]